MNQHDKSGFPTINEALLKELNKRFPEQCPELDWDQNTVWYVTGQRSVVRLLNALYKEQQENILGGN